MHVTNTVLAQKTEQVLQVQIYSVFNAGFGVRQRWSWTHKQTLAEISVFK